MKKKMGGCALALLIGMGLSPSVQSAPIFGETQIFRQPDGSEVPVVLYGDEFYMRGETPEGYTVVRDPKSGWICYAELSADGQELISTGKRYSQIDRTPGALGKRKAAQARDKGLRLAPERVREKALEKRRALGFEDPEMELAQAPDGSTFDTMQSEPMNTTEAAPVTAMPARKANLNPYSGAITGLVVVVDFSDEPAPFSLSQYDDKCNQENYYWNNGTARSLKTYFSDVSDGDFQIHQIVRGIYRAPKTFAEYDSSGYTGGAKEVLRMALQELEDEGFDFSQLTLDSDGSVQMLSVMYSGSPAEWSEGMWHHSSAIYNNNVFGGVTFKRYCTSKANKLDPDTMIHEYGHMAARWPDMYSYVGGNTAIWCVMGGGRTQLPNPYLLYLNGWLDAVNLNGMEGLIQMNSTDPYNACVYYDPVHPTEYFFVRPYTKDLLYSPSLTDEGLTIWRINTEGQNRNFPDKPREVDLVKADDGTDNSGGVCFKQGGILDHFTAYTGPSAAWQFNGKENTDSAFQLLNAGPVGSVISFDVSATPIPPKRSLWNGDETLFADTFARFGNADVDALGDGMSGRFAASVAGLYYEGYEGSGSADSIQVQSGRLRMAVGNGMSENGIIHNFIDPEITSAGGFSVELDVNEINSATTDSANRFCGFGVGLSRTEAAGGADVGDDAGGSFRGKVGSGVGASDFFVELDINGNVKVWRHGALLSTVPAGAITGTLRAEFSCGGFYASDAVTVSVFFNGSAIDINSDASQTQTFYWSSDRENHIGLSARAGNYVEMDNLKISTFGQDGDLLYDTFGRPNNNDTDAEAGGISGALAGFFDLLSPGRAYYEGFEPDNLFKTRVTERTLQLAQGGGGMSEAAVMHNFIDPVILNAGGFAVELQIDEILSTGTDLHNRYGGFGVGLTAAEAQGGADIGTDGSFRGNGSNPGKADFFVELDLNGNVKVWRYGSLIATVPVGATSGTLTAAFECSGFGTSDTVDVSIFFNGELLDLNPFSGYTQSFLWENDHANYLGLSARGSEYISFGYLAVRTLPLHTAVYAQAAFGAGLEAGEADPNADADGDGDSNFSEWAKGTDMNAANAPLKPIQLLSATESAFTVTQRRMVNHEALDVNYPTYWSTNLMDWTVFTASELGAIPVAGNEGYEEATLGVDSSITTGRDVLFIRGTVAP